MSSLSWYDEGVQMQDKQQYGNSKQPDSASDRITEQVSSDSSTIHKKQQETPLSFHFLVGNRFFISYRKKQLCSFLSRFICVCIFAAIVLFAIQVWAPISDQFKAGLLICTFLQLTSFCLLFFLDPGTLFEDEDERLGQQRLYCQICRIYKSEQSKHCVFCNKCVNNFDHHCSFFGKCIGGRNYFLFIFFIVSSVMISITQMAVLVYTLIKNVDIQNP